MQQPKKPKLVKIMGKRKRYKLKINSVYILPMESVELILRHENYYVQNGGHNYFYNEQLLRSHSRCVRR